MLRLLRVPTELSEGSLRLPDKIEGMVTEEDGIMLQRLKRVLMLAWRRKLPYALPSGVLEICP